MKNYSEFITEVNKHRDDKLMYQYGERNKPENYLPKDPVKNELENKKLAQGETLKQGNTYLAQIVSPGKSSQLKFPSTPAGINIRLTNTENEMRGVKSQAELIKKLGFRSLKDIDDRNP